MRNLTIGERTAFGYGMLIVIVTLLGAIGYVGVSRVQVEQRTVTARALPSLALLGQIESSVKENFINATQHVITGDAARKEAIGKQMDEKSAALTSAYKQLETMLTPQDLALYAEIKTLRAAYRDTRGKVIAISRAGDARAMEAIEDDLYPVYSAYVQGLQKLVERQRQDGMAAGVVAASVARSTKVVLVVGVLIAFACALVTAWWFTRFVNRTLRGISSELREGSRQLSSAAASISASSQSLASGASDQAASIEEASAALVEVTSMTQRNADHAAEGKSLAGETRSAAETGAADMQQMTAAMDAIKGSSGNIAKIIKTIDEIAFQTNILALNAAIEAARAGEAGMGFAVVAEEVRSLAQRSANAARETAASIQDSIQKSESGVEISQRVAASLEQIVGRVRQVDQIIGEIAHASHEQNQGIDQVRQTVNRMEALTQSTAANSEQSAAASQQLSAQAIFVDSVVEKLQLLASRRAEESARASEPDPAVATTRRQPDSSRPPAHPKRRTEEPVMHA